MEWIEILVNIFITMIFSMSFAWTLFPWGFAMSKFKRKYVNFLGQLGQVFWWFLIICHLLGLYFLWTSDVSAIWLVTLMVVFHLVYGFTIVKKAND